MSTERRPALDLGAEDAVRADLTHFFGPRPDAYLRAYERRQARAGTGRKALGFGWSWPAFGGWFAWFWYRKLWGFGTLAMLFPIIGGLLFPGGDVVGYLLFASLAPDWYVSAALLACREAEAQGLTGERRAAFLAERGGVSRWGGAVGMVLMVGMAVAYVAANGDAILVEAYDRMQAAGLIPPPD
jgi:hypothetical protein